MFCCVWAGTAPKMKKVPSLQVSLEPVVTWSQQAPDAPTVLRVARPQEHLAVGFEIFGQK